jgi:hypothetical protein
MKQDEKLLDSPVDAVLYKTIAFTCNLSVPVLIYVDQKLLQKTL